MESQIRLSNEALDLDYMRVIRFYLNTIALWPNETLGPKTKYTRILTLYHVIMLMTCTYSQTSAIIFAKNKMKTHGFIDMGNDYLSILLTFVIITRLTLILSKKYCLLIKEFVTEFHLVMQDHGSDFASKETRKINRLCRIMTAVLFIEGVSGPILFNSVPLYINYQAGMFTDPELRPENKTFVHSVNYYFIINQYKDMTAYWVVFVINFFISHICGVILCGIDLLIYLMVFHILGHFNILVNKIRNFPQPKQMADQSVEEAREYNEEAFEYLKALIRHDMLIKRFLTATSDTFSITLCICLFFHQVSGCITLLEISPMTIEVVSRYGILALILYSQLIQMSVTFELVASKSDTIPDEVYSLPWELMDVRNRKTVLMFLRNVQISRGLKAGGVISVGVLTMSGIIKNSISYFLILKTLGND